MRPLLLIVLGLPLALAACGGDGYERTVYIQQPVASLSQSSGLAGTTVVVPPGSSAKICPIGTVC